MMEWRPDDPFEDIWPNGSATRKNSGVRFKFTRFRDIALDTSPPYLVREFVPRVGVVIVWGKPKSAKTFTVFDLEMHISLGWEFRGRRVEQGHVLHIACEGVRGLGARKAAWRKYHTDSRTEAEIEAIDDAPFHLCKETSLDLIADADQVIADIITQFGDLPVRLITIDTLNRSLRGSESSDEDMSEYFRAAIALADKFQCCVIVIHHCGYNEDRPRGHSSMLGTADAIIEVKKDERRVIATVEEMRDGPNGGLACSLLEIVDLGLDDNFEPLASCVVIPDPSAAAHTKSNGAKPPSPTARSYHEALCEALYKPDAKTRGESYGKVSVPQTTWIAELVRRGLIDKEAKDNQRRALVSKYRAELVAAKWAACNGELIWSTKQGE